MTAVADSLESEVCCDAPTDPSDRRTLLELTDEDWSPPTSRWCRGWRRSAGCSTSCHRLPATNFATRRGAGRCNGIAAATSRMGVERRAELVGTRRSVLDLSVLNDGQSRARRCRPRLRLPNGPTNSATPGSGGRAPQHAERGVHVAGGADCTPGRDDGDDPRRLRGVMLPNHAPLVIAEQFAMLEELHRANRSRNRTAPGTDQDRGGAASRHPKARTIPRDFLDLMGLLGDPHDDRAVEPVQGNTGRQLVAGDLPAGLQWIQRSTRRPPRTALLPAHHFDTGGTMQATELYHHSFQPSVVLDEPYMIVTANVLAADSKEDADWHSAPGRLTSLGVERAGSSAFHRRRTRRSIPISSRPTSCRAVESSARSPLSSGLGRSRDPHARERVDGHVRCLRLVRSHPQHRVAGRALDRHAGQQHLI